MLLIGNNNALNTQNINDPIHQKLQRQKKLLEEEKLCQNENNKEQIEDELQIHNSKCLSHELFDKFTILDAIKSSCRCKSSSSK